MRKIFLATALVLILLLTSVMATSCSVLGIGSSGKTQSIVVPSTGTAYVVEDANNASDPQKLQTTNFSTQNFINVWYQWDVTGTEKDISVGLVQFDLSSLKGKTITSATLQMYVTSATLTQAARLVDISLVTGTWDASKVTYKTKPSWASNSIASSVVYGTGVWSSWDVSGSVASAVKNGTVSYAAGLDTMDDKSQEQVLYASDNIPAAAPRLLVTYTSSTNGILPWWVWVAGIVIIAIIAFFAGWLIMKHNASKAAVAEAGGEPVKKEAAESKPAEKKTAGKKAASTESKPPVFPDNKPNEPPK